MGRVVGDSAAEVDVAVGDGDAGGVGAWIRQTAAAAAFDRLGAGGGGEQGIVGETDRRDVVRAAAGLDHVHVNVRGVVTARVRTRTDRVESVPAQAVRLRPTTQPAMAVRGRAAKPLVRWVDSPGVRVVGVHDDPGSRPTRRVVCRSLDPQRRARLIHRRDPRHRTRIRRHSLEYRFATLAWKTDDRHPRNRLRHARRRQATSGHPPPPQAHQLRHPSHFARLLPCRPTS